LLRKQRKTLGGYFFLPHPVFAIDATSTLPSNAAINANVSHVRTSAFYPSYSATPLYQ